MYPASSDTRKDTTPAISSLVPSRPIGILLSAASFADSFSYNALENFVRIIPGAKQFTRIPSGAKSLAAALVRSTPSCSQSMRPTTANKKANKHWILAA